MTTLQILDANGELQGHIDRDASDAEFAAVLKALGADHFEWDPSFYDAGILGANGNLVGVLSPYNAT